MTDADLDMAAAELALGVLEGEERADALRRVLADPEFARDVDRWRDHFAVLFDHWPDAAAPPRVERRVMTGIAPDRVAGRFWPAVAITASAMAAVRSQDAVRLIPSSSKGWGPPPELSPAPCCEWLDPTGGGARHLPGRSTQETPSFQ